MYIRRTALPASPEGDVAPSSHLVLLPFLSLSVVAIILLFFVVRFVKRGLHLSNLAWLRGKSKRPKNRLGLSGVELLPTSFKSLPASHQSPFSAAFNLEGNAGKSGNLTLLSRSSSLDALPQLSTGSPPHLTSRRNSNWQVPFSLSAFFKTKNKPLHRRSRSLTTTHRTLFMSMHTSAPSSPKTLLVDISASDSSPMSASSDLGTHKLHPASPLVPGLPIPTSSPVKTKSVPQDGPQIWTFDVEDESHDIADSHIIDTLLPAFKRSQLEVHERPPADIMPLIQDDRPSSPPSPIQQLSTSNPFASLVDSFTSRTFISDRPAASSSSLPPTPSLPSSTDIKLTVVHSTTNLLDLSDDDVGLGYRLSDVMTGSSPRAIFVDPLITTDEEMASTHVIRVETAIDLADSVSDPFDDSYAVTFPEDGWKSGFALSPAEESHVPSAELVLPFQPPEPSSLPAITHHFLPLQERVKVQKALPPKPEELTSSWQWDSSWNPPSFSAPHSAPESVASLGEAKDKDANLPDLEAGDDSMSFDHEAVSIDEQVDQRVDPVVELGIDLHKGADPADTWFIEELSGVLDSSRTDENVKEGVLPDVDRGKGKEDDERKLPQEPYINPLDELLVGPSEPLKVHLFEEITENSMSERKDSKASPATTSSNENHGINETIMPYSTIPTPIIFAATPLPSTPATPNTPSPELPSLVLIPSSSIAEECPDPDIMPFPGLPPLFVSPAPVSPMPVKLQPPLILQAQTPTPPASPPPSSIATAKPSWSLRAAHEPSLELHTAAGIPLVQEVRGSEEAKTDDSERVIAVDLVTEAGTVVEGVIELAANQSAQELQERSPLSMLQSEISTLIPCCFPKSPSKPSAALPTDVVPPVTATDSPCAEIPQARIVRPFSNRVRTPRSVIDIAFAMQLRPGHGAGADPAWMVRFLMAVFGWFAILVSGDL